MLVLSWGLVGAIGIGHAQERSQASDTVPEMSLRKSVITRQFQGREFAGEEREIGRGETLWRILVGEKGLPEKRFHSYLVIIRGLNPQIKSLDVLRVGDRVFIPLRLDDAGTAAGGTTTEAASRRSLRGESYEYRVKEGEHLYRILREQLKLSDERALAEYYALVKDLNPDRHNWDSLNEGESIRLPMRDRLRAKTEPIGNRPGGAGATAETPVSAAARREPPPASPSPPGVVIVPPETVASAPAAPALPTPAEALRLPARENLELFARVAEALGSELQQSGEEVVLLPDGAVRLDKSRYPVVHHTALRQRIVIDPDGKIPASLKTRLSDPSIGTPILAMGNGLSIDDAVRELLAGLGYQLLPSERPVVIHEGSVAIEAKGDWMALAPDVSDRTQEVLVIKLTDAKDEKVPDYLRRALAKHGLDLREISLPWRYDQVRHAALRNGRTEESVRTRNLPSAKTAMIDDMLLSFGIAFGVAETLSVELSNGLWVDQRADRIFDWSGKRTGLFFKPLDAAVRHALQERHRMRTVEISLDALSNRDVIARLLRVLDDQAVYREHRFAAVPDHVTVKAWGFHVPPKGMFVTDREIPSELRRFFFENGMEIVYFR